MIAHSWTDISNEAFTEEAIRKRSPPEEGYRLFPNRYGAGIKFLDNLARPSRVYVLEGSCTYRIGADVVLVNACEYIDLLPGQYGFEVLGTSPVRLIAVYQVPELVRKVP